MWEGIDKMVRSRSKFEIANQLIEELSNVGDVVINFENRSPHRLYIMKRRFGEYNYGFSTVTEEQINEYDLDDRYEVMPLCTEANHIKVEFIIQ